MCALGSRHGSRNHRPHTQSALLKDGMRLSKGIVPSSTPSVVWFELVQDATAGQSHRPDIVPVERRGLDTQQSRPASPYLAWV